MCFLCKVMDFLREDARSLAANSTEQSRKAHGRSRRGSSRFCASPANSNLCISHALDTKFPCSFPCALTPSRSSRLSLSPGRAWVMQAHCAHYVHCALDLCHHISIRLRHTSAKLDRPFPSMETRPLLSRVIGLRAEIKT